MSTLLRRDQRAMFPGGQVGSRTDTTVLAAPAGRGQCHAESVMPGAIGHRGPDIRLCPTGSSGRIVKA
jgi:hypothetical protein